MRLLAENVALAEGVPSPWRERPGEGDNQAFLLFLSLVNFDWHELHTPYIYKV